MVTFEPIICQNSAYKGHDLHFALNSKEDETLKCFHCNGLMNVFAN